MTFEVGELYARKKIHEELGGGEPVTYLPQIKGQNRIAAGFFGRKRNPEAPNEVQVGKGTTNVKKAETLAEQDDKQIPVFVKRDDLKGTDKLWQYYGVYELSELLDDEGTLKGAEAKSGRYGELTYVLRLRLVSL